MSAPLPAPYPVPAPIAAPDPAPTAAPVIVPQPVTRDDASKRPANQVNLRVTVFVMSTSLPLLLFDEGRATFMPLRDVWVGVVLPAVVPGKAPSCRRRDSATALVGSAAGASDA